MGGRMRRRHEAGLARQRSVWREHDANLAKAWLTANDDENRVIVLDEFADEDVESTEASNLRVITLD